MCRKGADAALLCGPRVWALGFIRPRKPYSSAASRTQHLNAIMEFNESDLANRVSALAQGPEWKAIALRALENENSLVKLSFFYERDDAAAIIFLDVLIECMYMRSCLW